MITMRISTGVILGPKVCEKRNEASNTLRVEAGLIPNLYFFATSTLVPLGSPSNILRNYFDIARSPSP